MIDFDRHHAENLPLADLTVRQALAFAIVAINAVPWLTHSSADGREKAIREAFAVADVFVLHLSAGPISAHPAPADATVNLADGD